MKRIILLLALALATTLHAGVGATTNWVVKYVTEYVSNAISNSTAETASSSTTSTTNGITSVSVSNGDYTLTASYEPVDILCLTATNCTAAAIAANISNGERWVENGTSFIGSAVPNIIRGSAKYSCAGFSTLALSPTVFYSGTNVIFETRASYVSESKAKQIRGY